MKTIGISMVGSGFMGKLHTLSIGSYPIYYYPSDVQPRLECIVGHTPQAAQVGASRRRRRQYPDIRHLRRCRRQL